MRLWLTPSRRHLADRGTVVALVGEGIQGQVEDVGVGHDRCHGRAGYSARQNLTGVSRVAHSAPWSSLPSLGCCPWWAASFRQQLMAPVVASLSSTACPSSSTPIRPATGLFGQGSATWRVHGDRRC